MNHALVSFADPFTLRTWAGVEIDGLPSLGDQVRLFGESVLPELGLKSLTLARRGSHPGAAGSRASRG